MSAVHQNSVVFIIAAIVVVSSITRLLLDLIKIFKMAAQMYNRVLAGKNSTIIARDLLMLCCRCHVLHTHVL